MDWWKTEVIEPIKDGIITFVPAQHFSARGITDRNKTLWGGFITSI
jgi:L-ascorbate metabolism protein UlaG (beta-lactamase superfamily)